MPPPPPLPRVTSSSSATSHQSGTIKEHWNDLPASMVRTSPLSRSTTTTTPLSSSSSSSSSSPSPLSSGADTDADTDVDVEEELPSLLEALFVGTPSTLLERERSMLRGKVLRSLPAITAAQKREVVGILKGLLHGGEGGGGGLGRREAKEAVVAFMMRERGVAGWAAAVRRGVESVVLE